MRSVRCQKMFWVSLFGFTSILYIVLSLNKFRPAAVPIYPLPGTEHSTLCGSHTPQPQSPGTTIYFITPTYPRREQVAELTRLGQTLLLVPNVHWIVAEDSDFCSPMVKELLNRLAIPHTHLVSPQPTMYRKAKLKFNPRGVSSRRAGLHWIIKNANEGVVYFGDDDNTYDIRLFQQMKETKAVSMFPVGFIGSQGVSGPIVKDGKVVGFTDDWFAQRKFPVDMAGFAINVAFMKERNGKADEAMPYKAGYEEDIFLRNLNVTMQEIEPMGNNCEQVLVWHTKTVKERKANLRWQEDGAGSNLADGAGSNLANLLDFLNFNGMVDKTPGGDPFKTCYGGEPCSTKNWRPPKPPKRKG